MQSPFEIAGGSVQGSTHALAGRSNQDAFCWSARGENLIAVVCDGCSGAPQSDVGAKLASRLLVASAAARMGAGASAETLLEAVRCEVVATLRSLARAMSHEAAEDGSPGAIARYRRTAADHFLFTTVGILVDGGAATTFSIGDGLVVVNGERRRLGPFPGNAPPYLGYALLDEVRSERGFELGPTLRADDLQTVLLCTDGVLDLEAMSERALSGEGATVGPLRQFWEDDAFFRNPDRIRRRLTIINRGRERSARGGLLPDDTTLIAVRRTRERVRGMEVAS
jgi:hypothetical protein